MNKKFLLISLLYFNFSINLLFAHPALPDLTVVGFIKHADGLGRLALDCIDLIKNDISVNFIPTREINFRDIPINIKKIITNRSLFNKIGKVSILFDALWYKNLDFWRKVPNSYIKIAYSMLESTEIPAKWVNILNSNFDAVLVPDEFYAKVYTNSGVTIPIFVFPQGLYLDDFLIRPLKQRQNKTFTFGVSSVFTDRKNHKLLLEAFAAAFANNPKVCLKLHGRWGEQAGNINKLINIHRLKNVQFIKKEFNQKEYVNFLASLDCYVLLSKGEGYSVSPREALALGIPCILSNNTAHTTLCKMPFIRPVKSLIQEPAYYDLFGSYSGYYFNCKIEDAKEALLDVYNNYNKYLKIAHKARNWIKQYTYQNLKPRYLTLVNPKKVILCNENKIEDNRILTNSKLLYQKYLNLIN